MLARFSSEVATESAPTCCSRMCRSRLFLPDAQGALKERLSVDMLALIGVEVPQSGEPGSHIGMLRPQQLLSNRDGTLVQGLGFLIACMSFEIEAGHIEQVPGFGTTDVIRLDKLSGC